MVKNTRRRKIEGGSSTKDKQWWWATTQDGWKPFKRPWIKGDVVEVWDFKQGGNPENQLNNIDMFENTTDPLQYTRSLTRLFTSPKKRIQYEKKKKEANYKKEQFDWYAGWITKVDGVKYTIKLFDGTPSRTFETVSENIRQPVITPPKAREFKINNEQDRNYFDDLDKCYYTPGTTTQNDYNFLKGEKRIQIKDSYTNKGQAWFVQDENFIYKNFEKIEINSLDMTKYNYFIFLLPDNVSPHLEFQLQGYFKDRTKDPIDIWCICPKYMSAGDVLIVSAPKTTEEKQKLISKTVNYAQRLTQCQEQLAEAQQQLEDTKKQLVNAADISKLETVRRGGHRKKRMTRRNKKKRRMLRKSRRKRQF